MHGWLLCGGQQDKLSTMLALVQGAPMGPLSVYLQENLYCCQVRDLVCQMQCLPLSKPVCAARCHWSLAVSAAEL
jgi:hypothetical protein